jgi:hypothetical protein
LRSRSAPIEPGRNAWVNACVEDTPYVSVRGGVVSA